MTADDKKALEEAMGHRERKTVTFGPFRSRTASVEGLSVTQGSESASRNALRHKKEARREDVRTILCISPNNA